MTRQLIIYILILVVGLAGGIGVGFSMAQKKINDANITVDQLKTQQAQTEADFKTANVTLSRMEAELTKARNNIMQKNAELQRTQTESERTKKVLEQALKGQSPTTAPQTPVTTTTARTVTPGISSGDIREYTIKDGDSLWKIAANELGNGMRYKDILALNPNINENTTLAVDTKIKIPAK